MELRNTFGLSMLMLIVSVRNSRTEIADTILGDSPRPQCNGDPLDAVKFSGEEDVGFVRDVCVDKIARNIYNTYKYPNDYLCKELANIRTSTCFFIICFKWKRSDNRNNEVTNRVMSKAVALMRLLLYLVSRDAPVDQIAGESVYEYINDAKQQLIDSGAVAENSDMVDQLEDLKKFLCRNRAIKENNDLIEVVNQFFINFEAKIGAKILNHSIEDNVVQEITMAGIVRLKFKYEKDGANTTGIAIVKVPSLAPFYYTKRKDKVMYPREAFIYEKLLPALYELGKCEPFAPELYAITETKAMILEDLTVDGYSTQVISYFLDLEHSQIILSVLAQYHALSYVYFENVKKDDSIIQLIGSHQTQIRMETVKDEFDALCKVVKPLLSDTLYKKILMAENEILAKPPVKNKDAKNDMTVIIHGDLHRKNYLFKYDSNGKVYRAKIIDWQFSREANPMLDLIGFLVDNILEETFEANEKYLLESYLTTFNHNLSSLSINRRYTRSQLDQDMTFYKYYFYKSLSNFGARVLNGPEEEQEPYAANLAKWLTYLDRKGFTYFEENIFSPELIEK